MMHLKRIALPAGFAALAISQAAAQPAAPVPVARNGEKPRNVIFILSDDHRYDFMGFTGAVPWLQTPALDRMAREGACLKNAFVTTSLSSPSRASILTGLFTHTHTVVDNQAPKPDDLVFFPQYLQQNGYRTAFFGKWHMGNQDDMPQPGFDHWEGFRGQGTYYNTVLNINGERVKFDPELYSTDILTDHAIDFVRDNEEGPFFIYLSYKSVHSGFQPSPSRKGMYKDEKAVYPPSFNVPEYGIPRLPSKDADGRPLAGRGWYGENRLPDWVKNQRESWHGVDYQYHGALPYEEDFRNYCETVTSMDDAIGRLLDFLQAEGLGESTLVIYMGDNGFTWGEHGLIDKRNFYEPSVRVPMLAYCPELIPAGRTVEEMVQNIDVAPTIMAACGLAKAPQMCGESFLPLLKGGTAADWRKRIYYEYYWEYAFPQTPTVFGVRTDRYKYIRYHGIWDTNEFFDLQEDPYETVNLIDHPELQIRSARWPTTSTTGSKRPAACRFRSNGAFITGTATIAMRKLIKFVF